MASEILIAIQQSPWCCSFQGNFKNHGIGSAERSSGGFETIKSGGVSALRSDISEKQSILYTYACIEESITGRTLSNIDSKYVYHSHSWNG